MIVLEAGDHYPLGPSGSSRWLACPGSLRLSAGAPDPAPSVYAEEGTVAHALGEYCLKDGEDPTDYAGQVFKLGENIYPITEDMMEAVYQYVYYVRNVYRSEPKAKMVLEHTFNLPGIHEDLGGTTDCSIYLPEARELYVIDYKHGRGVVVSPENNTQLMIYALGAMDKFKYKKGSIYLTIIQPRAEGRTVKTWRTTAEDIIYWALHTLKPAVRATAQPDAPVVAGDHCRWCKAKPFCPALRDKALEVARTEFSEDPVLPKPETLTDAEVVKAMAFLSVLEPWIRSVGAYMQRQAEDGKQWPGYKLVRKKANRKWKDEKEAEKKCKTALGDKAFSRKLITVAQAEKAGLDVSGLWEKPDTGLTLVPESDSRKAVGPQLPAEFLDSLPIFQ
jgi:hypothetical protein